MCLCVCVRTCIGMAAYAHTSGRSHLRTISLVPCSYRDAPRAAPSRGGAHGRAVSTQSTQRDCPSVHEGVPPCEYSVLGYSAAGEHRCAAVTAALAAHNADLTAANARLVAALAALAAENARLVAHCGHCECSECLVSTRSTPLRTRSTVREYSQYPSGMQVLKQRGWDALEYSL